MKNRKRSICKLGHTEMDHWVETLLIAGALIVIVLSIIGGTL